jgi:putative ABC transport system substrate-binding protein
MAEQSIAAFRQGLRDLGWIEGRNIVIDYRFAEGRFDRLPDLAAELVRLNVEIIAATTTPAAVAARNATGTMAIRSGSDSLRASRVRAGTSLV